MAFSCGFYNSLNGDRKYNARQISELFDGIIRDGVYASVGDKLTVKQGTGMQITVGTGRAWFNHSWSLVDAEYPLTVDQSDLILDRIDAVVLEVNESTEVRDNSIKMVKGTAASSPQKPVMTDTEFVHQYPLAYISVKKGATEITTANIEINVGKDNCPYVTSILEAVSIEELYVQWEAQFKGWEEGQKTQFEEWFGEIEGQLSEDAAGNLQIQVNDVKSRVDNEGVQIYTHSKSGTVHEFTGNGPNGRAKMTANVSSGDTFTVNGIPVTAYMGTENAVDSMAGNAWIGKWVTFVFDGDTINFKGGGGLSAADKAKLIPSNIREGITIAKVTGILPHVIGACSHMCYKSSSHNQGYVLAISFSDAISAKNYITYTPENTAVSGVFTKSIRIRVRILNGSRGASVRINGTSISNGTIISVTSSSVINFYRSTNDSNYGETGSLLVFEEVLV